MANCDYVHKKFEAAHKRKHNMDDILERNKENSAEQPAPPSKRRQVDGIFRPWMDNEQSTEVSSNSNTTTSKQLACAAPAAQPPSTYHANMVRRSQSTRQRSPKEQQRRDRNTLACLRSRRARQAQDALLAYQYEQYCAQQAAVMEQQIRFGLYYRQLLQQAVFQQGVSAPGLALPQQQQQFLQQMALSQQLLIFGSQQ
ncbi:hypothetical protein KR222_001711 [Zaprionus bogoriensis]|nr:hypothetical protein KR222_001711 [Zaprionus bogoriensis]